MHGATIKIVNDELFMKYTCIYSRLDDTCCIQIGTKSNKKKGGGRKANRVKNLLFTVILHKRTFLCLFLMTFKP
jgi:hypothetical protein